MDRARRRKFGQNFLDTPTAQMIAGDLPAKANEAVLEIGPGHGALTEHLLDRAVELTAVEIDEQCVEFLLQKFQGRSNFHIENIDFLKFDLQAFLDTHEKPWVTGNLPYNGSSSKSQSASAQHPAAAITAVSPSSFLPMPTRKF